MILVILVILVCFLLRSSKFSLYELRPHCYQSLHCGDYKQLWSEFSATLKKFGKNKIWGKKFLKKNFWKKFLFWKKLKTIWIFFFQLQVTIPSPHPVQIYSRLDYCITLSKCGITQKSQKKKSQKKGSGHHCTARTKFF